MHPRRSRGAARVHDIPASRPRRRRESHPRISRVAAAAPPRVASTECDNPKLPTPRAGVRVRGRDEAVVVEVVLGAEEVLAREASGRHLRGRRTFFPRRRFLCATVSRRRDRPTRPAASAGRAGARDARADCELVAREAAGAATRGPPRAAARDGGRDAAREQALGEGAE